MIVPKTQHFRGIPWADDDVPARPHNALSVAPRHRQVHDRWQTDRGFATIFNNAHSGPCGTLHTKKNTKKYEKTAGEDAGGPMQDFKNRVSGWPLAAPG
jgi:hypothetical protein